MDFSMGTIALIFLATALSFCVGGMITNSFGGAICGAVAGLILGIMGVTAYQNSEIRPEEYDFIIDARERDCRLAPLIKSILADKIVSKSEYGRIEALTEELDLRDARGRLNQAPRRQCPSA